MTTILITGVGRGIGRELARQALAKDWRVIGTARDAADFGDLAEIGDFLPLVLDVTDSRSVAKAAGGLDEPIDILINNAGIIGPPRQSSLDMDFDGFAQALAVNTLAPLRIAQAFLPHLRKAKSGRILTISSQMGRLSYAKSDRVAYRASKAAVNKVMQCLATDLGSDGIAVLSIHPGWVRTDMGGRAADISPEESAAGILEIAENATMEQTGRFYDWDGTEGSW